MITSRNLRAKSNVRAQTIGNCENAARGAARTRRIPMIVSTRIDDAMQIEIHVGGKRMARRLLLFSHFALLLAMLFAMTARAQAPTSSPSAPVAAASGDISGLASDAVNWLQALIRIDTSNPPGNELGAAKYLGSILDKEGIHYEIIETAPGRAFLVARLSATAVPDPSRALLLMGHLDVVGVDKAKWTVNPFGGVIQGNYLYGRGAIDDKGMTIACLTSFIQLKRTNAHLSRDVIFLAEPDEEAGGTAGMKTIAEKYWDKIAAGFAINEGGRISLQGAKVQYVAIQSAEKTSVSVDVIAKGTSGHASMPRPDDPVTHLAAAIAKIGAYETPVSLNSVTRTYFAGIAPTQDDETGKWIRALETPDRGEHAARVLSSANLSWNSMMRDTIAPTMLQAGIRNNVIPADARGVLNIRLLPGDLIEPLLAKLQQLVNDPAISFEIEPSSGQAAPSSSTNSDLFNTISKSASKAFGGVPVVPYMSTYATDSVFLRLRNVQAYGMLPFPLNEDDQNRMHAEDERIPIDSFRKGIDFLYSVVSDFAASK
jgi:acetylornithine deacetylase/succinyl-diaminopimelate desuccinylase-like protein